MYTKSSYPLLVVVVIAMALCLLSEKLSAQIDPTSLCAHRPNVVFSSGVEDLSEIIPIGLQDCSSLENHFDEDLNDSNPLVVSLDGDQTYDFATLRSLAGESTQGAYTVVALDEGGAQIPLPDWVDFDSEYGVSSASPSCADQGSYLLEFNVAPGEGPGSVNPLFVQLDVSCPASFSVAGLDFENNGQVSGTPYHGSWADGDGDGVIDQSVKVREGRVPGDPWEAYVLSPDKNVSISTQQSLPSYITLSGNMIEFESGGLNGDSGTLDLLVCDTVNPADCTDLQVPWEYVHPDPRIVGLSYSGENGTVDNPNDQGAFADINYVDCTGPVDVRYLVAEPYDFEYMYDISSPAPNMGVDGGSGAIGFNADCDTQIGQNYFPSFQVTGSGGESPWVGSWYAVTGGAPQANSKKPDYR